MAKQTKPKQPIQEVRRPILTGTLNGADALRKAKSVLLGMLLVTFLYVLLSLLLSFDSLVLRIVLGLAVVCLAVLYFYYQGTNAGQHDAAFAEIMYQREAEGKAVSAAERGRCYHPAKGFFAALLGALPFVLIALAFAVAAQREHYSLGVLPAWMATYTRQSGIGDALAYYAQREGVTALVVLKVITRSMTMPFVNVAVMLGADAVLWCERLSPLWVLVAPLGFGVGYRQGPALRNRINTGIAIGDQRKKRREKRERTARQRTHTPERLI